MNATEPVTLSMETTPPVQLSSPVKQALALYFLHLKGHDTTDLYQLVMNEVEKPLLEAVLAESGHNQSKAAKMLGLSRSTLRKKLDFYGIG